MTKENSTEIVFVVDRSGSMASIARDMCGGFDAFIAAQRKEPGECNVTLAQFDDEYTVVYEGKPLADVPPLVLEPRGWTALLDAVGRTIDATGIRLRAMHEDYRPSKVLFVIITDGGENRSTEYTQEGVHRRITTQREVYSWEFVFLGANQDSFTVAKDLGIQAHNVGNFGADARGTKALFSSLSTNASNYRSGGGVLDVQATYDSAVKP